MSLIVDDIYVFMNSLAFVIVSLYAFVFFVLYFANRTRKQYVRFAILSSLIGIAILCDILARAAGESILFETPFFSSIDLIALSSFLTVRYFISGILTIALSVAWFEFIISFIHARRVRGLLKIIRRLLIAYSIIAIPLIIAGSFNYDIRSFILRRVYVASFISIPIIAVSAFIVYYLFVGIQKNKTFFQQKYDTMFVLCALTLPIVSAIEIILSFFKITAPYVSFAMPFFISTTLFGIWLVRRMLRSYDDLNAAQHSISLLVQKANENATDMAKALADTIDMRDHYTRGHSERVRNYALLLAWELGLDEKDREILTTGCMLHDLGKVGVRESVLNKPEQLTPAEYDEIKLHVIVGRMILSYLDEFRPYLDIVYLHHERFDGTGYPLGIRGKEIPRLVRIVSVADTFDALTSDRVYRKGVSIPEGLHYLETLKGNDLDPELVDIFVRRMGKIYEENPLEERNTIDEIVEDIEIDIGANKRID